MKIAINGGHYPGIDNGAVGDRLTEAELNQAVMELTGEILRDFGYEVLEVQEIDAKDIVKANNAYRGDLFLSLHCNASVNHAVSGTEVHYFGETGKRLASCVQARLLETLNTVDRGLKKTENLYVLRYTNCPAVLIEMAFITNREDEELLLRRKGDIAKAIAAGVVDYVASAANLV